MFPPATAAVLKLNRNAAIAGGVVLFHVAAIWALQAGLLRRTVDILVPVQVLSEIIPASPPQVEPALAAAPEPRKPIRQPLTRKPDRTAPLQDKPPAPAPPTMPAEIAQAQRAEPPVAASVAESGTPAATPAASAGPVAPPAAPAKVELPASDASYLQNPPLTYPATSKRLGEEGKVIVRVLIGADGVPQKAELRRSSGFGRLDQAALEYVMKCRYVPGKVGGVPQTMWYEAPVSFVLQ